MGKTRPDYRLLTTDYQLRRYGEALLCYAYHFFYDFADRLHLGEVGKGHAGEDEAVFGVAINDGFTIGASGEVIQFFLRGAAVFSL